jgi:hypothetical protein
MPLEIDQGKAKKEMDKGLFIKREERQDQSKTGKEIF